MTKITFLIMTIFALMLTPTLSSMDAFAAVDTLPGGTNIEVTVGTPTNVNSFEITTGTTVDVSVNGTADIGMGNALKNTDVIYILDVSGSMGGSAQVDCDGDSLNNDRRIDCAVIGINASNNAASEVFSSVSKTGLGTFNNTKKTWDLDLGTAGIQLLVEPDTDGDTNSIPDLIDVASGLIVTQATSYGGGLEALETILAESSSTNKIVIFLSDGQNNRLPAVSNFETTFDGQGVVFNAFAVGGGNGVDCNTPPGNDPSTSGPDALGNLNDVTALTSGGTCTNVTDMSTLANVITESIGSTLETLEIDVDNVGKILIDNSEIDPDLPVMGPAMVSYATTVSSLAAGTHNICVTATGMTAFGSGDVTDCVDITVFDAPPTLNVPTVAPVEATGPGGAIVDFVVTATDTVDGSITPICDATSGDQFPITTTTVNCSATDSAVNTVDSFFDIVVQDTTPPTLTVPADITDEATGPDGATVDFDVTATDIVDGDVTPDCDAASGDTFPVDTTTVTCSATDAALNTSVDSFFDITVEDTTPPTVTVPGDITVTTGDPSGTSVDFDVTATDIVDGDVTPDCDAASGDTFPVGTTIVTCSATDAATNTSVDSFFDITVELSYQGQKEEQITLLEDLIDGAPKKTQKELEKAIKSIQKSLDEKFWDSPTTLTEKHGHKVFGEEKSAVKDLLKIQKDDSTTDVSDVIDALVDVDENLAQDAIDAAGAFAGDSKVDKEIAKANEEMDKSQEKFDEGKPDKAIDHFKKAWEHAQKAIKHATK